MAENTTLAAALAQLAHAAAEAPDTRWTVTALAAAVTDLEHAAGASLGATEHDPLVVLQRRLGRAHRLLTATPATTAEVVQAHLQALHHPATPPRTTLVGEQGYAALARS